MNKTEAVKILKGIAEEAGAYPSAVSYVASDEDVEALNTAIEALEHEPSRAEDGRKRVSEDCISKHDIWKIIEDNAYWVRYNENSSEKGMTLTGINQALNECPPVTPAERTGECCAGDCCAGCKWEHKWVKECEKCCRGYVDNYERKE